MLPVIEEGAEFCWLHQSPDVYVWQCMSQLACARHAHLHMAVDGCPFYIRDARRCEERGTWRVLQPRNARVLSKVALVCDGCAPYVDEIGRCFHVDSLGIRCPTPARIGTHACARHRCQEWITREGQSRQCEHAAQACSVNEPVLVCGQHDRRSISNDPEECERVSLPVSSIPLDLNPAPDAIKAQFLKYKPVGFELESRVLRPDPFVVIDSVEERKKCADKLVGMWLMRDVRVVFRTAPASDRTIVLENWGSRKIPVEFRTREWILSRFSFKHGLEMPTVFSGPGIHYFYGTTILNFSSQPSAEEFLKTWSGFLKTRFFPQVRNLPCPLRGVPKDVRAAAAMACRKQLAESADAKIASFVSRDQCTGPVRMRTLQVVVDKNHLLPAVCTRAFRRLCDGCFLQSERQAVLALNRAHLETKTAALAGRYCEFPGKSCHNYRLKDAKFCGVHVCCHYAAQDGCKKPVDYSKEFFKAVKDDFSPAELPVEFERRRWQSQEIHNGRPLGDFEFCGFLRMSRSCTLTKRASANFINRNGSRSETR